MRLSVIKHRAKNHAAAPWLVVVPKRLSVTGRRQFRYFVTKAAAERFAVSIRRLVRCHGETPVAITAQKSAEARMAEAILADTKLSLVQAAILVAQLAKDGLIPQTLTRFACSASKEEGGLPHAISGPHNFRSLSSVLKEMLAAKVHQSPYTQRARTARFNAFFRRNKGLIKTPVKLVTAKRIMLALDTAWPNAPSSWNIMLTHLITLFNYAMRKGYISSNPLLAIDRKHVKEKEILPISPTCLRALLLACRPPNATELLSGDKTPPHVRRELTMDTSDLAPYIAITAFAGIRPAEALRLQWGDINLEEACISVRRAASKTGGTRHVDIHPTLRAWLEPLEPQNRPPSQALFQGGANLTRSLRAIRRRAGFDASNPWPEDALRHSYASYYLKAGGELSRLQLNMGHSSPALIYARYCNMRGLTRNMAAEWWSLTPQRLHESSQF